jgi:hypothetical protein
LHAVTVDVVACSYNGHAATVDMFRQYNCVIPALKSGELSAFSLVNVINILHVELETFPAFLI